jgi:hypothetical protein
VKTACALTKTVATKPYGSHRFYGGITTNKHTNTFESGTVIANKPDTNAGSNLSFSWIFKVKKPAIPASSKFMINARPRTNQWHQ